MNNNVSAEICKTKNYNPEDIIHTHLLEDMTHINVQEIPIIYNAEQLNTLDVVNVDIEYTNHNSFEKLQAPEVLQPSGDSSEVLQASEEFQSPESIVHPQILETHNTFLENSTNKSILQENSNNTQATIPIKSPFEKHFLFPDKLKPKNSRKVKENIPSVGTSEEWDMYYLQKEQVKQIKKEEVEERKKKKKGSSSKES